ncbi:MAG: hypothetical protein ACOC1F_12370 [Myxococcota bacterium]
MATDKNKASNADDDLQIPIQKTNPLIYAGIAVGVFAIGGIVAFTVFGKDDPKPDADLATAVHSARLEAAEAKAKEIERRKHLELAAKAFAAAEEKEKAAAAASAAAAAAEEEETVATSGSAPAGGGAPPPPKPAGPSKSELDQLDELGSAVNSELGGP